MASESRARSGDADDRGAGGKLLRPRRRTAALAASPYHRQEEGTASLRPPKTEAKGWFSGIGRFFTSVFGSERGSGSSCSCTSDSDPDEPDEGEYKDGVDGDAKVIDEAGIKNQGVGHQLPAPSSNSKMLIEKLLQQETYSRDESKKLIEVIQSRVVESPMENGKNGIDEDFSSRTTFGGTSSPTVLGSLVLHNLLGRSPDSPSYLSTLHSSPFADQLRTAHSTNATIMEAKKWVEEKRLSNSKSGLSGGPCTLNSDLFYHELERNKESPIDIAKSYMHALPPWRSPISSSAGFRTPSAALKRNHLEAAMRDAHDVAQDMRQKLDAASSSVLGKTELSKESFGLKPFCEKTVRVLGAVPDSNGPRNGSSLDATENAEVDHPDAIPDTDEAGGTDHILPSNNEAFSERDNTYDHNVMASEASLEIELENSAPTLLPSKAKVQSIASHHATDRNQVVNIEEPLPLKEQAGNITLHVTSATEHNGDRVEDALNAEPMAVIPGKTIHALLSDEVPITDDITPDPRKGSAVENHRREDNPAGCQSVLGSKLVDENNRIQKPVDLHPIVTSDGVCSQPGSSARSEGSDKSNADPHDTGNKKRKATSGGRRDDPRRSQRTAAINQPQLGATTRSVKRMSRELPTKSSHGRGRKSVTRGRRGREK